MILLAGSWYLQDLIQAAFSGIFLVPDIFFMFILFRLVSGNRDVNPLVWSAFAGGLLWDLRWTTLPGFTAALYASSISACLFIWDRIPDSGRSPRIYLLLGIAGHLFIGLGRMIFLGESRSVFWGALALQQIIAVPLLIISTLVFSARRARSDVRR